MHRGQRVLHLSRTACHRLVFQGRRPVDMNTADTVPSGWKRPSDMCNPPPARSAVALKKSTWLLILGKPGPAWIAGNCFAVRQVAH